MATSCAVLVHDMQGFSKILKKSLRFSKIKKAENWGRVSPQYLSWFSALGL
jgi:hypothetical protein